LFCHECTNVCVAFTYLLHLNLRKLTIINFPKFLICSINHQIIILQSSVHLWQLTHYSIIKLKSLQSSVHLWQLSHYQIISLKTSVHLWQLTHYSIIKLKSLQSSVHLWQLSHYQIITLKTPVAITSQFFQTIQILFLAYGLFAIKNFAIVYHPQALG
jgi:hypothetical protein